MSKQKPKYKITKKYINIETGLVQAAQLLDIAAVNAVEAKDNALMVDIAAQWVDISRAMTEALKPKMLEEEEEEESTHRHHEVGPVGFGVTAQELKEYHDRRKQHKS